MVRSLEEGDWVCFLGARGHHMGCNSQSSKIDASVFEYVVSMIYIQEGYSIAQWTKIINQDTVQKLHKIKNLLRRKYRYFGWTWSLSD